MVDRIADGATTPNLGTLRPVETTGTSGSASSTPAGPVRTATSTHDQVVTGTRPAAPHPAAPPTTAPHPTAPQAAAPHPAAPQRTSRHRTAGPDMALAPGVRRLELNGKVVDAVPIDIQSTRVDLAFDVPNQTVNARARVVFDQETSGLPILQLAPEPESVLVDGRRLPAERYAPYDFSAPAADNNKSSRSLAPARLVDPDRAPTPGAVHRVVEKRLSAGRHQLEVGYSLDRASLERTGRDGVLGSTNGGATFDMAMWDIGNDRRSHFLEAYAPSNLEYDHHSLTLGLSFTGANREHRVITNGEVKRLPGAAEAYEVTFPKDFNTSAPFLQVVDPADVDERQFEVTSRDGRKIQVLIYSLKSQDGFAGYPTSVGEHLDTAVSVIQATLAEMETRVGPYPYARFVAHVGVRPGGMEFAGATDTSLKSLRHELIHSWWGRGVMPADGASGWLDEALTTWFTRGTPGPGSWAPPPEDLNTESRYARGSGYGGYGTGVELMQAIDQTVRTTAPDGEGLLDILRPFFAEHVHKSVTPELFRDYVLSHAPESTRQKLSAIFASYGYPVGGNPS